VSLPRLRSSEAPIGRSPGWVRRVVAAVLYPFFGLVLVVPAVRNLRRKPGWQTARLAVAAAGFARAAAGVWVGVAAGVAALLLPPVEDPDRLRKLAARLGARHLLNGGLFERGDLEAPRGSRLLFFLTPEEILVAAAARPDKVLARGRFDELQAVRLDGMPYAPRYVSFAKEPPRQEQQAVPAAVARLALAWGGRTIEVEYRGVFARHLAEVAAHGVWSMQRAATQLKVL